MSEENDHEIANQNSLSYFCAHCRTPLKAPKKDATKIKECPECGKLNEVPFISIPISEGASQEIQKGGAVFNSDYNKKETNTKFKDSVDVKTSIINNSSVNNTASPTSENYDRVNAASQTIENPKNEANFSGEQYDQEPTPSIGSEINDEVNTSPLTKEAIPETLKNDKKANNFISYQYILIFILFFAFGFFGFKYQNVMLAGSSSNGDSTLNNNGDAPTTPPPSPQPHTSPAHADIKDQEKQQLETSLNSMWKDFNESIESAKAYKDLEYDFQIKKSLGDANSESESELRLYQSTINNNMLSAGNSYKEIYDIYKDNPDGVNDFLDSIKLSQGNDLSVLLENLPKMFETYKNDDLAIKEFWKENF